MRHLGVVLALVMAITAGIGEARTLGAGAMKDAAGVGAFHGMRKMLQSCSACPSTCEHWERKCFSLESCLPLFVGVLWGVRLLHRAGRPSALGLPFAWPPGVTGGWRAVTCLSRLRTPPNPCPPQPRQRLRARLSAAPSSRRLETCSFTAVPARSLLGAPPQVRRGLGFALLAQRLGGEGCPGKTHATTGPWAPWTGGEAARRPGGGACHGIDLGLALPMLAGSCCSAMATFTKADVLSCLW